MGLWREKERNKIENVSLVLKSSIFFSRNRIQTFGVFGTLDIDVVGFVE